MTLPIDQGRASDRRRECLRPTWGLVLPATAVGLLDVSADLVLTIAVSTGPLAVVGPLASLDPVVAVLVAVAVLHERLGRRQAVGVAVAVAGTVLVSIG